jgi:hypothetical protein
MRRSPSDAHRSSATAPAGIVSPAVRPARRWRLLAPLRTISGRAWLSNGIPDSLETHACERGAGSSRALARRARRAAAKQSPASPESAALECRLLREPRHVAGTSNRLIPAKTVQANGLPQDPLKPAQGQGSSSVETTNSPFSRPHPEGRLLPPTRTPGPRTSGTARRRSGRGGEERFTLPDVARCADAPVEREGKVELGACLRAPTDCGVLLGRP